MKYLPLLLAFTLFSCTKQMDSISLQQSSNSVTQIHASAIIPFEFLFFIPCTNEWVHFTGDYDISFHEVANGNHLHQVSQLQHKNTVGIGQTTGKTYKIVGQANDNGNYNDDRFTYHQRARLAFATQGSGNRWVVTYHVQVMQKDDGEWIVLKSDFAEFCK